MSIKSTLVGEQFRLIQKIGQGSFGKVYLAHDLNNNDKPVAIKTESLHQTFSQLLKEIQNFKALESKGYPPLIKQGISVENEFIYMVTELLGPSLEDLFNYCGQRFSLKTTLMLFHQLLERVEFLHSKNYIHRDIKPDNIMMGIGEASNIVHMIDFGLTRLVIDPKTGKHIPFISGKNLIGTCRYVSVNSHMGFELSRRDDLITLGYVMINFLKGGLPWQGININKPSARYRRVGQVKVQYSNERLCQGCPKQFVTYMDYVTSLRFEEAADFFLLKQLIVDAANDASVNIEDNVFDWSVKIALSNRISSDPNKHQKAAQQHSGPKSQHSFKVEGVNKNKMIEKTPVAAKEIKFNTYNDVKMLIYKAYNKHRQEQNKNAAQQKQIERKNGNQGAEKQNQIEEKGQAQAKDNYGNNERRALKNYISSPEWHKEKVPVQGEEEKKEPAQNAKQRKGKGLAQFEEYEPPNFKFYNVDRRKPKVRDDSERGFRQAAWNIDSQGSFDPRERLMGLRKKGNALVRPVSNKIDRFGRIAFNKNKELSQASLDVDNDGSAEPEEEKKMMVSSNGSSFLVNNRKERIFGTDGRVRQLNRPRFNSVMMKKGQNGGRNRMELEFSQAAIIKRLDKMQSVLGPGKVVNQSKLLDQVGDEFERSKLRHKELQEKQKNELKQAEIMLKVQASERQEIHQRVGQEEQKQMLAQESVKQGFAGLSSFANAWNMLSSSRQNQQKPEQAQKLPPKPSQQLGMGQKSYQIEEESKVVLQKKGASLAKLESMSDCSAEIPSEHEDEDGKEGEQAAAYKPKRYQECYHEASLLRRTQNQK